MKIHLKAALISVTALCLISGMVWAKTDQATTEKAVGNGSGRPVIVIKERVFNAGKIHQGETISHDFKVRNEGDAPLKIDNVKPG